MTKRKAADIRADWSRATPGPWRFEFTEGRSRVYADCPVHVHPSDSTICERPRCFTDFPAIANAPTDIAALLDWQERAKEYLEILDELPNDNDSILYKSEKQELKRLLEEM